MDYQTIAQENFSRWNDMLKTLDPAQVAALYAPSATFLPTLSPDFKQGQNGAREYFEHFLAKHPVGEIIESRLQIISDHCYLHSGMYNFEVDRTGGGRETVMARFSFVWQKDEASGWQIIHHHSSLVP